MWRLFTPQNVPSSQIICLPMTESKLSEYWKWGQKMHVMCTSWLANHLCHSQCCNMLCFVLQFCITPIVQCLYLQARRLKYSIIIVQNGSVVANFFLHLFSITTPSFISYKLVDDVIKCAFPYWLLFWIKSCLNQRLHCTWTWQEHYWPWKERRSTWRSYMHSDRQPSSAPPAPCCGCPESSPGRTSPMHTASAPARQQGVTQVLPTLASAVPVHWSEPVTATSQETGYFSTFGLNFCKKQQW